MSVIRKYLQQEIEGQLREVFKGDLPGIIHRFSQSGLASTRDAAAAAAGASSSTASSTAAPTMAGERSRTPTAASAMGAPPKQSFSIPQPRQPTPLAARARSSHTAAPIPENDDNEDVLHKLDDVDELGDADRSCRTDQRISTNTAHTVDQGSALSHSGSRSKTEPSILSRTNGTGTSSLEQSSITTLEPMPMDPQSSELKRQLYRKQSHVQMDDVNGLRSLTAAYHQ
ncbi:unnamed protein product [Tilletia controversa]|uniref:Uncharacterized protein n=2 Tax=Tilletia TaxID=13289 RepID=A0A177VBQ9_9BASI|nr:hypothetical protein CF336_g6743 [Tilletia laevis]KAE8253336.1 hypothetical protein A4X03_0g5922 [Tilletia caries]CAD6959201.1 unnamed protein product [Tilletia controversa]KAE8192322.1 hypothetical protein CF335_g5864 [Tilletia laevis]CAD6892431.1 unnamed protein product [Tilletia caries]